MARPVMLVTGGSRGIGAAVCRLAAREGFDIVVNYARDREAAQRVVAAAEAAGARALAVQADMGVAEEIDALFEAVDGFGALSALVNNAGVVDEAAPLAQMSAARLERMWRINLTGPFLCAQHAARRMSSAPGGSKGGRGGVIVNISSAAAKLGGAGQYVDYAASKGAIDTMTVGLAKELAGAGIRVCGVRPGIIDTDIHASGGQPNRVAELGPGLPMGRAGTPEEVAEAVLWLVSAKAGYSSGAIIDVSGVRSVLP